MNWLLLILSGCIELVFTFCLSKVSKTCGSEKALWIIGTVSAIALSLYLVTKVLKTLPIGTRICRVDGNRCRGDRAHRDNIFP